MQTLSQEVRVGPEPQHCYQAPVGGVDAAGLQTVERQVPEEGPPLGLWAARQINSSVNASRQKMPASYFQGKTHPVKSESS